MGFAAKDALRRLLLRRQLLYCSPVTVSFIKRHWFAYNNAPLRRFYRALLSF